MLEIRGLDVHYGGVHALRGMSLTVSAGEIVALLGNNGAGKTTTLAAVSGLVRPTAGKVLFEGEDVTRERAHKIAARGLVHVPEGRRIFSTLSVHENLQLGGYLVRDQSETRRRIEHVYELLPRLAERRAQQGGTLSGGEQQMLAIGRALMARPTLLLLDEPSMGLSPILVETIFRIVQDINRQGTTILLVEQNARMALRVAHRGYVIQTGRIVLQDDAAALLRSDLVRKTYLGEK